MTRGSIKAWAWVHTWTSLVSTAFLLMLCVTGLPLIFRDEIDRLTEEQPTFGMPGVGSSGTAPGLLPLDAMLSRALANRPGEVPLYMAFDNDQPSMTITTGSRPDSPAADMTIQSFDRSTGELIASVSEDSVSGVGAVMHLLLELHTDMFLGLPGMLFLGVMGLCFVAALVSGGEWGIRLNGTFRSGDASIDDEFRSTTVLGAAIDYNSGPLRASLDLAYQRVKVSHFRPKLSIAGLTVIPEAPDASTNFGQPWQFTTLRDIFGQARLEYDIARDVTLYAAIGAHDGSEEGVYSTPTLVNAATGEITVSSSFIPRTDNNEAATAGLRAKFATGGITHEVNAGGSINWLVNRNAFEFFALSAERNNLYAPVEVTPSTTRTFASGDLDDPLPASRTRLYSLFVSDTIGLWNDRILLTAGARLQAIKVRSFSVATGAQTGAYDEDKVTPVFGIVVKPAEGLPLYANRIEALVQGATAPASGANPAGGAALPVTNAGEVLPPFVSEQYEIGGKLTLGGIDASLALFQIDRETAILRPSPTQAGALEFGPFGVQRNRGVEFTIAGELSEGLRLIAGGSVIDAKLRRTLNGVNEGNQAVGVPEYLVNANVEWDVAFIPALTLTGRVVHTGEQLAAEARAEWDALLAHATIEGDARQQRTFTTALYHAFLHPSVVSDADGRFRGPDGRIRTAPAGHLRYSTFSLWDTFRAAHPLYTLLVPERVDDFVASLLDHQEAAGAMLDTFFFELPVTEGAEFLGQEAMIGQYANGNEPSRHVAWLYAFTDRPERTPALVRRIAESFYRDTPDGLVSNEDAGQMSAWYVFATLGFYPLDPVSAQYVAGLPLTPRAVLRVPGREPLTITRAGCAEGPVSVTLAGKAYPATGLPHAALAGGGTLVLSGCAKR